MSSKVTLSVAALFVLASIASTQQPEKKDGKKTEERPSQEAVLGKNTLSRLGISFGSDDKQKLDVYSPKGIKGAPVVVFIHGGEWTKGDKENVSFKPKFLNDNGVIFVSTNYRLSPAVKHPAHVADIASAIRWVRDHAEEIGADPAKIVIMGHSAGCHLATLVALDPSHLTKVSLKPADLAGVVAWSGGFYDLPDRAKGGGKTLDYIKQAFGEEETGWRDGSPMAHVGKGAMPPFLLISVEKGNASHQATEKLAEAIRATKGTVETRLMEGRSHFMSNHLIGAPDDTTGEVLLGFIRKVTK